MANHQNINVFTETNIYNWLHPVMIPEGGSELTIKATTMEEVQMSKPPYKESKLVVWFNETDYGFILSSKRNTTPIAQALGGHTQKWIGAKLHLVKMQVEVRGEKQDTIRVVSVIRGDK